MIDDRPLEVRVRLAGVGRYIEGAGGPQAFAPLAPNSAGRLGPGLYVVHVNGAVGELELAVQRLDLDLEERTTVADVVRATVERLELEAGELVRQANAVEVSVR